MKKYISSLLPFVMGVIFLQPFNTEKLYKFESETSHGTAALLFYQSQLVDTISIDKLQTTENSAVYIEFIRYTHEPPYDWDAVYGAEGNYRVFHNGHKIPQSKLPHIDKFSSPRLHNNHLIYWGFTNGKVFGFKTNLNSFDSDSILIFKKPIGTDYKYAYDFPIPKDSVFLFRTLAGEYDSVSVNFKNLTKIKLN